LPTALEDFVWWAAEEHRLVYKVTAEAIIIVSCRYHYD
jgi:Txe/YoeB family toxin of Txe-Axe toxin-antitoxin module